MFMGICVLLAMTIALCLYEKLLLVNSCQALIG